MLRDSLQSVKSVVASAASSCGCWGVRVVCCGWGVGGKVGRGC